MTITSVFYRNLSVRINRGTPRIVTMKLEEKNIICE